MAPACQSCYQAKVRCGDERPCPRCTRLMVECIPRVSRQGQGPKKRRRRLQQQQHQQENIDGERISVSVVAGRPAAAKSEDENLASRMEVFGRHHYGVLYLIHSWVNFAFARRSFGLLARASKLAAKCGVPMDEIFNQAKMEVLSPIMFVPSSSSSSAAPPLPPPQPIGTAAAVPSSVMKTSHRTALQWSDIPARLLEVCKAGHSNESLANSRSKRYILVREAVRGQSHYLLSDAFRRDICSLWTIEETWRANEQSVVNIFLEGQSDFDKFVKVINYHMSRYHDPTTSPECSRVNGLNVKMKSGSIQTMDLIYAFEIVNLDHSFYLSEYVLPTPPHHNDDGGKGSPPADNGTTCNDDVVLIDPLPLFGDLEDLEVDADFESFLDLIGED